MGRDQTIFIVGAGVIGAAAAHALKHPGRTVYVLEAEAHPGTGISSRNSGVIHAGLYYPEGSLKQRLCREGRELLYAFAEREKVPHVRCGKYIVANTDAENEALTQLWETNRDSVPLEPNPAVPAGIRAAAALFSPTSGIVDIHALIHRLLEQSQAEVLTHQRVQRIESEGSKARLWLDHEAMEADWIINCAGMAATNFHPRHNHVRAKGSYFQIRPPKHLKDLPRLVYPAVPKMSPGLGVHLTQNVAGELYLGPDVSWPPQELWDYYGVDAEKRDDFYHAARTYLPWLEPEMLQPAYAGMRPKLLRHKWSDFHIEKRGRVVHCTGIESPGITASLAVGKMIAEALETS